MRAGVTCYLGVNVDGALLSLGDGHARQGEGETCGVAVECAYQLVTQALANVCDTNYTSIAKMAKRYLSPGGAMDGAHERLRELARDYR
jgi:hypothetical protein